MAKPRKKKPAKKKPAKRKATKGRKSPAMCGCPSIEEATAIVEAQSKRSGKKATVVGDVVSITKKNKKTGRRMCMVDVKQPGMKGGLAGKVTKRFVTTASC